MKKYIVISLVMLLTHFSFAQDWVYSLEEAKKNAANNDTPIVLVFAGSDWCAPCIKLDKEIWQSNEFKDYAKDHYVMLKADFPRRKKNRLPVEQQEANNKLAEKFNKQGHFPLVVVLDKTGKLLGTTGYKKIAVKKYIEILNSYIK